MGWKNSPPIFYTAIETVADLANPALRCNTPTLPHNLDEMAGAIVREAPSTLQPAPTGMTRDPYLRWDNAKLSAYVDVLVDNFLGLAQGTTHQQRQIWRTLFHTVDKVFQTYDSGDSKNRKIVLSLKKQLERECTWSICQVLLGWIIDTVNMTLFLSPHRGNLFNEILAGIHCRQKHIGVEKWHQVLGDI